MSISDQITRLNNAKAAIKQAISNKGVEVSDEAKLDEYPALIDKIEVESGGGGESGGGTTTYQNPDFYEMRTKGGTDYSYLFSNFKTTTALDLSNWDISKLTNVEDMFTNCNISEINLSGWSFRNDISMKYFFGWAQVQKLDLSNWDISKITNMSYMFSNSYVVSIDGLNHFDTSNVTSMEDMFASSSKLTSLDLSSFNTSNVTTMTKIFYYCSGLTSLSVNHFDTREVTKMNQAFYGLIIESLDLSNWDTSKVTNMYNMFFGCKNLITLDISNFDTSKVTDISGIVGNCNNLKTIIGELDLSKSNNSHTSMFQNCNSLETVYIKNIFKDVTMTNASKWSINLGATKVKDECLISIINELPDLKNDKGLTTTSSIVFTLPKTNTLTAEQVQVAINKGWSVANTTY